MLIVVARHLKAIPPDRFPTDLATIGIVSASIHHPDARSIAGDRELEQVFEPIAEAAVAA